MRTSEIQEKMVAQMGITIDDYYADPSLAVARDIFRSITRCGPSDEEVEVFLHAQKPYCNAEACRALLEENLKVLEAKKQAAVNELQQWTEEAARLKKAESAAYDAYHHASYWDKNKLEKRQKEAAAEIENINAASKRPPVKQIEELEEELASLKQELEELAMLANEQNVAYHNFYQAHKAAKVKLKELKYSPDKFNSEIYSLKEQLNKLSIRDEASFKKDDDALDFLFAILLGIRLKTKDYNNTFPSLPIPLTLAEKMTIVAKHMKRNNLTPKDWRQQLHRVCSMPLKRFMGSISNPTEERMTFFEMKKSPLSATDLSAFLALKIAALNHEFILTGAGAIVLALPGGLAASVTIREKGKVIAKQQKSTVETYINLLKSKNQYAYHLMYHYDGGPAEGVGIETPGAYYILSETYVFEITFMAAPMLLGFDIMAKTAQNISIVARLDEEQIKAEEQLLQQGDWESED